MTLFATFNILLSRVTGQERHRRRFDDRRTQSTRDRRADRFFHQRPAAYAAILSAIRASRRCSSASVRSVSTPIPIRRCLSRRSSRSCDRSAIPAQSDIRFSLQCRRQLRARTDFGRAATVTKLTQSNRQQNSTSCFTRPKLTGRSN